MPSSPRLRLALAGLFVLLLYGCGGGEGIRGQLTYDLRPQDERDLVFWPINTDVPRYRYLGELVGEPNFVDAAAGKRNPVVSTLHWLAGVNEKPKPLLLQRPNHGAVDAKGRVFVTDASRAAVLVFDPTAPADKDEDRGPSQLLVWDLAGPGTRFLAPVAVAMVWGGDIAVSDATLGFVARIDPAGAPVGRIGAGHLSRPTGLAYDAERRLLFVSDTVANDIKVYDEAGRLTHTFGAPGAGPGEFNAPTHLAFAGRQLYVADTLNSRIQVFDSDGRFLRQFGERGLTVGNLVRPKGVAAGGDGTVYVVESYFGHLLAYTEESHFLLGIDGSGLKDGKFLLPAGVWTDGQGRVFVADMFNGRIVIYQFLGHDGS